MTAGTVMAGCMAPASIIAVIPVSGCLISVTGGTAGPSVICPRCGCLTRCLRRLSAFLRLIPLNAVLGQRSVIRRLGQRVLRGLILRYALFD